VASSHDTDTDATTLPIPNFMAKWGQPLGMPISLHTPTILWRTSCFRHVQCGSGLCFALAHLAIALALVFISLEFLAVASVVPA